MKIKKNGQVIRLTESDLQRIVKRVLTEGYANYLTIDVNPLTKEIEEVVKTTIEKTGSGRDSEQVSTMVIKGLVPSWKKFLNKSFGTVGSEDTIPTIKSLMQDYSKNYYPKGYPETIKSKLISLLGKYTKTK